MQHFRAVLHTRHARTLPPLPDTLARRHNTRRLVVRDASRQSIAYVYSRETEAEAWQANVLTADEARRIAANIARLPRAVGEGRAGVGCTASRERREAEALLGEKE
jgi:hypothetical protein